MGIRFYCETCSRKLNVKSFLAGKRGICPHCGARVMIPLESQIPSSKDKKDDEEEIDDFSELAINNAATSTSRGDTNVATSSDVPSSAATAIPNAAETASNSHVAASTGPTAAQFDPIAESPDSVWYVRPPTGGQFGPATGEVMRKWISEGRVSADSLVWCEGWEDWRTAGPEFPELLGQANPPSQPSSIGGAVSVETPAVAAPETPFPSPRTAREEDRYPLQRRKSGGLGVAVVVLLGILVVLLGIILIVILFSGSGDSPSDQNARWEKQITPHHHSFESRI